MQLKKAIALAAIPVLAQTVYATAFTWDGQAGDSNWVTIGSGLDAQNNWSGALNAGKYPGSLNTSDTATINKAVNMPAFLNNSVPNPISSLSINATVTGSNTVALELRSSAVLTVSTVTVTGEQSGPDSATLDVQSGASLSPTSMTLTGSTTGSNGHAIVDIASNVNVNTATSVSGFVDISIASATFNVAALTLNSGADLQVTGSGTNPTLTVSSYSGAYPISLVGPITMQH